MNHLVRLVARAETLGDWPTVRRLLRLQQFLHRELRLIADELERRAQPIERGGDR